MDVFAHKIIAITSVDRTENFGLRYVNKKYLSRSKQP